MNSLVIGNTSQLNFYFPNEYERISSRNINLNSIKDKYDTIFLLFAEQRTFLNESLSFFTDVNVDYTLHIINELKEFEEIINLRIDDLQTDTIMNHDF